MDEMDRAGNEVNRLVGLISGSLGPVVSDATAVAELLVREGYSPEEIIPQFSDLPSTRYVKDGLSISLSNTHNIAPVEGNPSFVVFRASGERYIAYLPLNQPYSTNPVISETHL